MNYLVIEASVHSGVCNYLILYVIQYHGLEKLEKLRL